MFRDLLPRLRFYLKEAVLAVLLAVVVGWAFVHLVRAESTGGPAPAPRVPSDVLLPSSAQEAQEVDHRKSAHEPPSSSLSRSEPSLSPEGISVRTTPAGTSTGEERPASSSNADSPRSASQDPPEESGLVMVLADASELRQLGRHGFTPVVLLGGMAYSVEPSLEDPLYLTPLRIDRSDQIYVVRISRDLAQAAVGRIVSDREFDLVLMPADENRDRLLTLTRNHAARVIRVAPRFEAGRLEFDVMNNSEQEG